MAYKILTKKGIENTNIDGARENFFNSGMRDGIVKGAFNEGKFASNSSNSIYLDSCELRIAGHRVIIDEPIYKTFSNMPSKDTRYNMVAQILVSESGDVEFSLFVQSVETVLIKDNLYATGTGQGTYQVEIGRFTLTDKGTVEDVVKTIDNITGTTESIAGGINIGNVTTEKIDYTLDAEVDVNQRYDSEQKKTFTDFYFHLPLEYPVDLDEVAKNVEQAKTEASQALNTAESLETKKADRTELFSGDYNDLKNKPTTSDWTTVYDMTSEDESLNWGYTAGLQSAIGLVSNSIDFTPYKFIRVYYYKETLINHYDFDIEAVRDITSYIPYFTCIVFDASVLVLTGQSIGLKYDSTTGQRLFYVGRGRSWALKTNAYNTSTDLSTATNCYIFKIQVK